MGFDQRLQYSNYMYAGLAVEYLIESKHEDININCIPESSIGRHRIVDR